MVNLGTRFGKAAHNLREAIRVSGYSVRTVHRLFVPRSRDQLHCPRDFADVTDRLASFVKSAGVGHQSVNASAKGE